MHTLLSYEVYSDKSHLQAAVPCAVMAVALSSDGDVTSNNEHVTLLELRGGTDAAMAPPVDYFRHVLLPVLRERFGLRIDEEVLAPV